MSPESERAYTGDTTTTCDKCSLQFEYDPKLHHCRTGPVKLAGPWIDEIREKQGVPFREDRA